MRVLIFLRRMKFLCPTMGMLQIGIKDHGYNTWPDWAHRRVT
jgi:hypothetical protein